MRKTIEQQIACAERELVMREKTYPKWIKINRMTDAKAQHEIDCMRSILATLLAARTLCEAAEPNPERERLL